MLLRNRFTRGLQAAAIFKKTKALLKLEVTDFHFSIRKSLSLRQ